MLYRKFQIENKIVGIWKISESLEDLLLLATPDKAFLSELEKIISEKRKKEKLATRCLLLELLPDGFQLEYLLSGKPQLVEGKYHLSISHTGDFVAVALSELPIGIDIQQWDRRVEKVKSRFVSESEYIEPELEFPHLMIHWSAKEAMFKWLGKEEVNWTEHLFVKPFSPKEKGDFEVFETKTDAQMTAKAYYEVTDDFVLVLVGN